MKMKPILSVIAATVIGITFGAPAFADTTATEAKHHAKAEYKHTMKQADADYKAAKANCNSLTGNDKDVCVKEAKASYQKAKADAKVARTSGSARAEAGEDKREANYKVAKQKCDAKTGDQKDACVAEAKAEYKQ
jgi:hypothetical protein